MMRQHDSRFLVPGWAFGPESVCQLAKQLDADILSIPGLAAHHKAPGTAGHFSMWASGLFARFPAAPARVTIIGWSLGAMIALEAAMACPDSVERLVLLAGTARFIADTEGVPGIPERNLRAMTTGLKRNREMTLDRFHQDCCRPMDLQEIVRTQAKLFFHDWSDEELFAGLEYLRTTDLRPGLAAIKTQVLLIHGNEDAVIPCAASEALTRALPHAELRLMPGAGHALPILDPDRVAKAVLPFLEQT